MRHSSCWRWALYGGPRPPVYHSACPGSSWVDYLQKRVLQGVGPQTGTVQPARALGCAIYRRYPARLNGPLSIFCLGEFWQPIQDGGEGRTRTFEAIRRLIYSQLPLPLGTLPRPTASEDCPPEWRRTEPRMALMPQARSRAAAGAFMGEAAWQSQPTETAKSALDGANCLNS